MHICYGDTHTAMHKLPCGVRLRNGGVLSHSGNHIIIQGLRLVRQEESWESQKPGAALGLRAGGGGEGGGGRQLLACPRSLQSCRPPVPIWPGARPPSAHGWAAPGCWAVSCWDFLQVSTETPGLSPKPLPSTDTYVQPLLWLTPSQGACTAFQGCYKILVFLRGCSL